MSIIQKNCLIVGCGKMGLLHGALANRVDKLGVSGLVDSSFQSRFVARGIGIEAPMFSSIDAALKKVSPGVAIICTPPNSHFSISKKFLENGWGVFVEKPLTMDAGKSKELSELANANELYNQVGFHLRFNPVISFLYDLLSERREEGKGEIESLEISILSPQFSKISNENLGASRGGGEWDLLPHAIDLGFFLLGILEQNIVSILDSEKDSWRSVKARIGTGGGAVLSATADWANDSVRKVETMGRVKMSDGEIYNFDLDKIWTESENRILYHRRTGENPFFEIADQEYSFQMQHLADNCVDLPSHPASDFNSSWLVDHTVQKIKESLL